MFLTTSRFQVDLTQPRVMGIVNLTPDSFSDGGRFAAASAAVAHAERLLREGAELLDLGAESSRPGAPEVPADLEWQRLEGVLKAVLRFGVPVSVDTCKPEVMARALDLGVDLINDIKALQAPGALELLASHPRAGVCLMHMRGTAAHMQQMTDYADIVADVRDFLLDRALRAQAAGIAADRLVIDPGYGFAKTAVQNLCLQASPALRGLGYPILAGWSRKSTLGWISGAPTADRLPGSLAAALAAVQSGARILRVHDVGATVQALRTWNAMTAADA